MEFVAQGVYTSPVAPRTLTLDLKIGGSTRITTGAFTVPGSQTNAVWKLQCAVTTRNTGASADQIANCYTTLTSSTPSSPSDAQMPATATWTVDTTGTLVIDFQATWDSTTGSPSITSTNVAAWIPGAPVTSVAGLTGAVPGQGTDSKVMTAGTISGAAGTAVCLDANGGLTTSGCSAGGGSFVLVEQHTASSSANLTFSTCISSTYDDYQIRLVNLVPANNGVSFNLTVNGDTGNNYNWSAVRWNSGASAFGGGAAQASIGLTGGSGGVVNTSTQGLTGYINMFSPGSTALVKYFEMKTAFNDGATAGAINSGTWNTSGTAATSFEIQASSGNIASGTVRCYGLAK